MKTSFLILALSVLAAAPARADVQSILQSLNAAQTQIQSAQQQIESAKFQLLQLSRQQGPQVLCVYNIFSKQYTGRGASEDEATKNAIFQCATDPQNSSMSGDCEFAAHENGHVQCRNLN
ncbi:MAG: hypothetical protein ACXVB9_01635 [Bdellovibrionota bacterium]